MSEIEQLRALLGKLPNPTEALELLDKAALRSTDDLREVVVEKIAEALGGAMDCTRAWSAWGIGTMSEDDFVLVADDAERLSEIADAAISAVLDKVAAVLVVGGPVANQCDGCCRGLLLDDYGMHRADSGHPVMACQRDRYAQPASDSIPRARLDELLAAEKRVLELESAFSVLEGLSPLECMNLKTCAENGEWSVQELLIGRAEALAASKPNQ